MADPNPETTDWSQYEAIVEKRWDRYRPRFERFAHGAWLSWNWAALFATFAWLRYRRMYAWSWLYFFVSTPFLFVVFLLVQSGDTCERALEADNPGSIGTVILAAMVAGWVVPPLIGDRIYFAHVQSMIVEVTKTVGTKGFVGALFFQAGVVLLPALSIASYGSYIYRAMVSEGVSLAAGAKTPVQEYFNDHGRLPLRIEEVAGQISGKYVRTLALGQDGTIKAVYGDGGKKLVGRTLSMIPARKDGKIVGWSCRSDDLPNRCLPASCRRD